MVFISILKSSFKLYQSTNCDIFSLFKHVGSHCQKPVFKAGFGLLRQTGCNRSTTQLVLSSIFTQHQQRIPPSTVNHNETERNQTYDGKATFEDFANYLLTLDVLNNYWDGHFISSILGSKSCDVEYDYVIKLESLDHDIAYLKQKLNISDYHKKAVFPRKSFKL